ncbi:hypothetical protein METBIDRAFT_205899 [Metschnikowia bicuspidata var. bicuspidata NRRL YB-4993]|uniref:Uncharacterized protein n=1 Tax=Metschnikowia bicuspidata var. bicuspidata NRRL YB-4993 TaxID=869754 RepID=A0A1A0H9W8_9ASCO|nr:hypothetical protein METBIDRAFT_205899 [Metschnikowia bicuspidata var. bicuspidata NRRL YB-4993]OBA20795.1 hypothetical protein METBIDRAFT_205899 [Metschnikowia bicuspidata var. bicuspidata NRRL YB-4993]
MWPRASAPVTPRSLLSLHSGFLTGPAVFSFRSSPSCLGTRAATAAALLTGPACSFIFACVPAPQARPQKPRPASSLTATPSPTRFSFPAARLPAAQHPSYFPCGFSLLLFFCSLPPAALALASLAICAPTIGRPSAPVPLPPSHTYPAPGFYFFFPRPARKLSTRFARQISTEPRTSH